MFKEKAVQKHWRCTSHLTTVILIIYTLAGYRAAPAVHFLQKAARKRKWPEKSDEDVRRLVEDMFVEADLEELAGMCDMEGPTDPAAMQEAVRVVEEWRAFEYVKDMNTRLGLAPSTAAVLELLEHNRTMFRKTKN